MQLQSSETCGIFKEAVQREEVQKPLSLLRLHHVDTYKHSCRVALLSVDIGIEKKVGGIKSLACGALLHDIGKVHVPKEILEKQGPLDDEERWKMQYHPLTGFYIMKDFPDPFARHIVISHHEFKKDPYPRKIVREYPDERNILGQIVAVADIFDALASRRSYKPPLSKEETKAALREQFLGGEDLIARVMERW